MTVRSGAWLEAIRRGGALGAARVAAAKAVRVAQYNENPKRCANEKCQRPIAYESQRTNIYCCSSCAATVTARRPHSESSKEKTRKTMNGLYVGNAAKTGKGSRGGKYVNGKYVRKSTTTGRPRGGLREGAGYSKSGWYRGVYCNSTWELAYVIHCLDHGVDVKRCNEYFHYGARRRKYFPDFVVADTIIEIKGRVLPDVAEKIAAVESSGRKIRVLYREEMKPFLEYARNKFGAKFETVYELRGCGPKVSHLLRGQGIK